MNNVLILPNYKVTDGYYVFSITSKCYQKVQSYLVERNVSITAVQYMHKCFSASTYMLTSFVSKQTGMEGLNVYTGNGVFTGYVSNDGYAFVLSDFRPEGPQDIVRTLHSGINLHSTSGTLLNITITTPVEIKAHYFDGVEKEYWEIDHIGSPTERILEIVSEASEELAIRRKELNEKKYKESKIEDATKISEAFEAYLNIAENYALYEDEAAATAAQGTSGLNCISPCAPDNYDRKDKVAYTYEIVGDYDDAIYKQNTKVDVPLSEERTVTATIVGFGQNDANSTVTLLFDDIISFNDLPQMTIVRLGYSRVMYEVQQQVIDDLREKRCRAQFLDRCIGDNEPEEYVIEDLSELEYRLNNPPKGEYPPTASQMDAIKRGISCKDILLVQGPPGTGKTTVIAEWVKYFCQECNYRVLISSQNNKAVDNVLERIEKVDGVEAVRAGNETKVQANLYHLLLENKLVTFRDNVSNAIKCNSTSLNSILDTAKTKIIPIYAGMMAGSVHYKQIYTDYNNIYTRVVRNMAQISKIYAITSDQLLEKADDLMQSIRMKVNKKQSTWNGLVKLFCNSSLRRLYKNYEEVYAEYQENQYNYYHAVEALIHRIHNSGLREKLDILNAVEETQKNLYYQLTQISIETSEFVDSGVFELPTDIWDDLLLRQKYDGIIEEIARISARLEVLREWEKTVLYQNNYALSDALFESVNLVGATCIGINSQKKFANMNFDVTIIDEAGQIQIHNALVPMSRSPKLIMLGDHKQIPPIANDYVMQRCSEDGVDTKLEEISLFEDIFTKLPDTNKVLLDTQFRMPAEIADILSEWFYEGKYLSGKNKQGIKPIFPEIFDACFIVVDTGDVDKRFEEKVVGYINRYEAEVISRLLRYMVNKEHPKHLDSTKIGVISPYGNQVKLLVSMLRKIAEIGKDASEIAATLDSFQGQERDVIIYSCTRSNQKPHDAKGRIGFLKELRRLNVALSRPKELLVFVGDIKFLSSCTYGEGEGSPKEFSQFIQLIMQRVNEGKGQYIKSGELLERIGEEIYG